MIRVRVRRDDEGQILKDDRGSSLVIALVFMTVFGILLAVVMGFIDASFRATLAVRDQSYSMYAGDAAIDASIHFYRSQFSNGRVGRPCPTYGPMSFGQAPDIYQVTVTCEGMANSGSTFIPNFDETVPEQAILTLSTSTVIPGILVEPTTKNAKIKGDVWSNSTINVSGGTGFFDVLGAVTAKTGCNAPQRIIATTLTCTTSTERADPNYPMATTIVPAPPPSMPTCADSLLKFFPGTYTSVDALNTLTGNAGCGSGKTYWFQPGVYYFDFQDGDVWDIRQGTTDDFADYVAGTPRNWDPQLPLVLSNRPVFGESCKTEDDFPPPPDPEPPIPTGVQFIFGGVSRLDMTTSGEFEMCAQPSPRTSPPQQQIAIFGVTTPTGFPPVQQPLSVRNPTTASSPSSATQTAFSPLDDGKIIDNATADAPLNSTQRFAEVTLSGFCPCPAIPAGSIIDSAELTISHSDPFSTNGQQHQIKQITATVSWNSSSTVIEDGGTGTCPAERICRRTQEHEETIDLKARGLDSADELNGGITATFQAEWGNNTPTEEVDGMQLEVLYSTPGTGFQKQTGALTALDENDTPLFRSSGPNTGIAIHGTIYAPLSGIDVTLNNRSEEAINRGAVLRYAILKTPASLLFEGYPISLPEGTRGGRGILLRAIVDPPDGDPRVRVRAVIDIDDGCQILPCEVGQTVTVRSWSFVR